MPKKLLIAVALWLSLFPLTIFAQATDAERKYTAFDMRSNGKIYVVVTVVLIILLGLILYLVRLDRKISRLEKDK
jgi:hypothetical protein